MDVKEATKNKSLITKLDEKRNTLTDLISYFSSNFSSREADKVVEKAQEMDYWIMEMEQNLGMKITLTEDDE